MDYPPYLFAIQNRQRDLLRLLQKKQLIPLAGKRILEIGCGKGSILLENVSLGARPEALFGIDILHDRLVQAKNILPLSGLYCADGQRLPFDNHSFESGVVSSIFRTFRNHLVLIHPDAACSSTSSGPSRIVPYV